MASSLVRLRLSLGQLVRIDCPGPYHGHIGRIIEVDQHLTAAVVAFERKGLLQTRWFTIDSLQDEWTVRLEQVAAAARAAQTNPAVTHRLQQLLDGLTWIEAVYAKAS